MKGRTKPKSGNTIDTRKLVLRHHELPVSFKCSTFTDDELILGKFGKNEQIPQNKEPLVEEKDQELDVSYLSVAVGQKSYASQKSFHPEQKFILLLEKRGDKMILSRVSREMFFHFRERTHRGPSESDTKVYTIDELNNIQKDLIKHKRIKEGRATAINDNTSDDSLAELVQKRNENEMEDAEIEIRFKEITERNNKNELEEFSGDEDIDPEVIKKLEKTTKEKAYDSDDDDESDADSDM